MVEKAPRSRAVLLSTNFLAWEGSGLRWRMRQKQRLVVVVERKKAWKQM